MELWRVGIDVGGTFTDIVALAQSGTLRQAKTLTTPADPLGGLLKALDAIGLNWADVSALVHGTTLITNSLVEGRLARVFLVTTAGFEDLLEIDRASRDQLYRLDAAPRVKPVVPRELVVGAAERLAHDGTTIEALSGAEVVGVGVAALAQNPEAVAICLLHAYANPEHERRLAAALREQFAFVTTSCDVSPEAREFERATATCLNAAVMPRASRYLDHLTAAVPPETSLHLFHSAGGMAPPELLRDLPLALAQSGPAAGAHATADVCRTLSIGQAVGFDMGGTTTDVCLIIDGTVTIHSAAKLGGYPVRQPMVGIESVGAGGGSIVRAGNGGLTIGPDSAGAAPGPACYGLGGEAPTITDINAVLGFLDPGRALGGEIRIDVNRARLALQPIATSLGLGIEDTAIGVLDVANAVMARALGKVTVQRGIDLRQSTLVAFGGAGPMHAASLARHVGIARVLVPNASSAFSAFGCVTAEPMFTRQRTVRLSSATWNAATFESAIEELATATRAGLGNAGASSTTVMLLIRYVGQSVAVEVTWQPGDDIQAIGDRFRLVHHQLYRYATAEPFLIDSIRVTVSAPKKRQLAPLIAPSAPASSVGMPAAYRSSQCLFARGKAVATPWYDRATIPAGSTLPGPCILADAWSTIVIPPGATGRSDEHGHILIEV